MQTVREGSPPTLLDRFAQVADSLNAGGSHPGAMTAEKTRELLAETHPTRSRCRVHLWVHEGAPGRVAAIINPRLMDAQEMPVGQLGFYECGDDLDAARDLLAAGVTWLREQGCRTIRGPINFSTWHDYRFVTRDEGFGYVAGEPDHLAYYPAQWQQCGFVPCGHYSTNWMVEPQAIVERFAARARKSAAAGVVVRPLAPTDLPALYRLSLAAFAPAYMYSSIEPDEFVSLYAPSRASAASTVAYVAQLGDGNPVGFLYSFTTPLRGHELVSVCKSIAVEQQHQDKAIYHHMVHQWISDELAVGRKAFAAALMHCEGTPARMGWTKPETALKEYSLFEYAGA